MNLFLLEDTFPLMKRSGKFYSLLQDERWRAKVIAIQESKDFTKFNLEQLASSLMTHELHLRKTENSINKGLALAINEQEESKYEEEEAAMLV